MIGLLENIQMMFATVGCFLGWFLGGVDGFMYALITFIVLDYITGLMVAVLEQRLSSEVGFKGIFKKILIFILVGAGHMIDYQVIGNGSAIRTAVVFFYIANEGISIIENAAIIGVPIPQKLRDVLEQLRKEGDSGGNDQ